MSIYTYGLGVVPGERSFFHGNEQNEIITTKPQGLGIVPEERLFFHGNELNERHERFQKVEHAQPYNEITYNLCPFCLKLFDRTT